MNVPLSAGQLLPASAPARFAEQQHSRLLINCYAREVALQEHTLAVLASAAPPGHHGQVLEISLPRMDSWLRIGVLHVSATANFEYTTDVYLRSGAQPWRLAGWHDVATLIIEDLSRRTETPFNNDLLQQIGDSIATMNDVLARHPDQPPLLGRAPMTALEAYIDSEQSLVTGHPFHPAPKSRSDWSPAEQRVYSPEHKASLRLHYLQVPLAWLHGDGVDDQAVQALHHLAGGLAPDNGCAIVPMHPWQAGWMQRQPGIAAALRSGAMRDLGVHGAAFRTTASVRTLLAADAASFIKLSLNMRITNCVRNNARHELQGALTGTRLYRALREPMRARFPGFHVLEEQAYATVDIPGADAAIADGFGVLLREGVAGLLHQQIQPVVCAALFGNGAPGRQRAFALIERYALHHGLGLEQAARAWFAQYARTAVHPTLHLLFEHGLAFEPHMQNTLVGLDAKGAPVSFIVRDLELTRLAPRAHHLAQAMALEPATLAALCCDDERAWIRIGYCLFVNNLCEVIAAIANGNHALSLGLWGVLRDTLQDYLAQFPNPSASRRIQGLLAGEPLPAKGNLLTRFMRQADRQASYLPLYHPLGVVNSAAASSIL